MTSAIEDLIEELTRLPGIGRKTAFRLAYYLVKQTPEEIRGLARALERVGEAVHPCSTCGNLTESDPCAICKDPERDQTSVCVVEEPSDVVALERSGGFRGLYHVLGGCLSPLEGVGPGDLTIQALLDRLSGNEVREVILATNPSVEGEATAVYVQMKLQPLGLRVSRIAMGLPVGGDIEYADDVTLAEALEGRRLMSSEG